jgi:hypothetical protein
VYVRRRLLTLPLNVAKVLPYNLELAIGFPVVREGEVVTVGEALR